MKCRIRAAILILAMSIVNVAKGEGPATEACNRGVSCLKARDFDGAIAAFREAIRIDPKNSHSYCTLGDTYRRKGDYENAIAEFTRAIRINPNDSDMAVADYTGPPGSNRHLPGRRGQTRTFHFQSGKCRSDPARSAARSGPCSVGPCSVDPARSRKCRSDPARSRPCSVDPARSFSNSDPARFDVKSAKFKSYDLRRSPFFKVRGPIHSAGRG